VSQDVEIQIFMWLIMGAMFLVAWNGLLLAWRGLLRRLAVRRVAARLAQASVSSRRRPAGHEIYVTGLLGGRRVRVAHQHLADEFLTCAVQLDNAVDGLSIYPTHGSSRAFLERERRTGRMAALGEEALDAKFAVQGQPGEEAARLFRSGQLESALDELFGPLKMMRVTTEGGWLVAIRRLRRGRVVDSSESLRAVQALVRVAPLFSRRELRLDLVGRSFAFTDGGLSQGAVCPYCRDSLDVSPGASGQLARCESCRTVHHEECYAEAGGCTVMGCAAQARQRRRAARI
jgi:hypothetical protein